VIVATGRMFRSVRPYLEEAGITDLVVCYQGAAVIDPVTGTFVLHEPIPLETAREAIARLVEFGHSPNCYVDDRLYVDRHTEYSRMYADFQHLPVEEVGDLTVWLERPPTKLVAVAEPAVLAEIRPQLERRLGARAFLTTSLPYMLEIGNPEVTKGSGLSFVTERLGVALDRVVAFGDGENDVELLEAAGFGVAVEGGHPRLRAIADTTCSGPADEGVASVIEAVLDSKP